MKTIAPDPTMAVACAIHRSRDANGQPLHSEPKIRRPVRLHEQVDVIRLHAELEHAKAIARCRSERAANGIVDTSAAE
jgi:hypothetical protein